MISIRDTFIGGTGFTLLLSLPLTFFLSWLLLRRYRREVRGLMGARTSAAPDSGPRGEENAEPPQHPLLVREISAAEARQTPLPKRYRIIRKRLAWQSMVYGLAFALYAAVSAWLTLTSYGVTISIFRFLVLWAVHLWPLTFILLIIQGSTRRQIIRFFGIYALAYFGVSLLAGGGLFGALYLWAQHNLPLSLALWLISWRKVRAASFLILPAVSMLIAAFFIGPIVVAPFVLLFANPLLTLRIARWLFASGALGLGWMALLILRSRYQEQKTGDQSIWLGGLWLLFAVYTATGLAVEGALIHVAGIVAAWMALQATATFILQRTLRRQVLASPAFDLLLLRVFALEEREARLFAVLQRYWRHIGHIRLIAGRDLALSTVDPHEFLDFLSGTLEKRFIDDEEELQAQAAAFRLPDADGRYRVIDFFCFANTWKMALLHLATTHDRILMDLRGFSPKNAGCVFEIRALLGHVPLERVLLITDDTTDRPYLREVLQTGWEKLPAHSPNRKGAPELHVFKMPPSLSTSTHLLLKLLLA